MTSRTPGLRVYRARAAPAGRHASRRIRRTRGAPRVIGLWDVSARVAGLAELVSRLEAGPPDLVEVVAAPPAGVERPPGPLADWARTHGGWPRDAPRVPHVVAHDLVVRAESIRAGVGVDVLVGLTAAPIAIAAGDRVESSSAWRHARVALVALDRRGTRGDPRHHAVVAALVAALATEPGLAGAEDPLERLHGLREQVPARLRSGLDRIAAVLAADGRPRR